MEVAMLTTTPDFVVEIGSNLSDKHNERGYNFTDYIDPDYSASLHMFYYVLWTIVTPTIFSIIFVVGTVGNSLVIYVIVSKKKMRTATNIMLLNLAIADISFLFMCVPFTAYKYAASAWPFGTIVCKVMKYFLYVTSYVTVYTLVAISALRFVTIVCSGSCGGLRTKSNVAIMCVLIWVIMLVVNSPVLLIHLIKYFDEYSYCGTEGYAIEALFLTFFVFAYALPLAVICFLYLLIMCHLSQNRGSTIDNAHARERTAKACKVIVLVVVIFGLSWLPLHVQSLVAQYGTLPSGAVYEVFRILWNCLAYGNSCANPIIYNYSSSDFRKSFNEVFLCFRKSSDARKSDGQQIATETTKMIKNQTHV